MWSDTVVLMSINSVCIVVLFRPAGVKGYLIYDDIVVKQLKTVLLLMYFSTAI